MKGIYKGIAAIVCIALAQSCATKVVGLKKSDDFVFNNLKAGNIAVGGVTSAVAQLKENEAVNLGNMLKAQILEERGALSVAPVGIVKKNLGDKKYASLLKEYEELGTVSNDWYPQLKGKLDRQRYVVFARIENDAVTQDRNETPVYNSDGTEDRSRTTVTSSTTREVTANFQVLDLFKNEVAWSGTITKTLTNSQNYKKIEDLGIVKIVKAIKGTKEGDKNDKYPYPEAPATQKVVTAVFNGFSENLPKED